MLCTFKCFIRTCSTSTTFLSSTSSYYFNYKTLQRDSTYSMYIFNYNDQNDALDLPLYNRFRISLNFTNWT